VRAMHPAARMGYLDLLLAQWQSADSTIPTDPIELAELSGLGDELWAQYGNRILRNFDPTGDGRLRNQVCFTEWAEAQRIHEARRDGAHRMLTARSPRGEHKDTSRRADTITLTTTLTKTKDKKTSTQSVPPEELAGTLPLVDGSEFPISKAQVADWQSAFPGVDVKTQLMQAKIWLRANPTRGKTRKGILRFAVGWLDKAQNNRGGIANPSRPLAAPSEGYGVHPSTLEKSTRAKYEEWLAMPEEYRKEHRWIDAIPEAE
jgi:hypothetical protein